MAKLQSNCTFAKAFTQKFGAVPFEDVFASYRVPAPAVWTWLEKFFGMHLQRASPYEDVFVDRLDSDVDDADVLTIRVRLVGDEQDEDTEVPARLATRDLHLKLIELGAMTRRAPPHVDWELRNFDFGYGAELHTTYNARASFRLSDCIAKKPAAQLDAEIVHALRRRK